MSMMDNLKEKFENLKTQGYREWLNNNSAAVTVGSVAILLLSLAVIINQNRQSKPSSPGNAYFYDVVTKELISDKVTRIAPITTADGHEAVRAHYFSCAECADGERFLGYYEKYTAEMKEKLEKNPQSFELYDAAFKGRLYCAPELDPADAKNWVGAESAKGQKITEVLQTKCPARKLRYCPGK